MSTFIGGKLKLKGGDSGKAGGIQKKKKKQQLAASQALELAGGSEGLAQLQETGSPATKQGLDGHAIKPPSEDSDRRTKAERTHDERVRQREEERLKTQAHKSHRDNVKGFNEYLTALSEHHDIPKVGPG